MSSQQLLCLDPPPDTLTGHQDNDCKRVQILQKIIRDAMQSHSLCLADHVVADLVVGEPIQATSCQYYQVS
jgi:hypothetical protein